MMDITEIKKYLPHRYPFLLIDRVVDLVEGESIVAYKNVSANEEVFSGHFPDKPVFPGVLVVEALAQASAILGFKTLNKTPEDGSIYLFTGIDKTKFRRQIVPGDQLYLESKIVLHKRNIWKFKCTASVDGVLVAEASITCADQPIN